MKYTEITANQDLNTLLKDKEKQLFDLRVKQKTMQLKNTSELRFIKKDIARIKTAMNSEGKN
ncbi:MAG: 50S ribosomal protein L29 [Deltaproteobacteria bacterium]|nr:MAG: 50S ribosomal protein L29 [Deltaproteobacteria bacterium]